MTSSFVPSLSIASFAGVANNLFSSGGGGSRFWSIRCRAGKSAPSWREFLLPLQQFDRIRVPKPVCLLERQTEPGSCPLGKGRAPFRTRPERGVSR